MVEFFKLFLAIFKILNKRVLDKKIRKSCQNKDVTHVEHVHLCLFHLFLLWGNNNGNVSVCELKV